MRTCFFTSLLIVQSVLWARVLTLYYTDKISEENKDAFDSKLTESYSPVVTPFSHSFLISSPKLRYSKHKSLSLNLMPSLDLPHISKSKDFRDKHNHLKLTELLENINNEKFVPDVIPKRSGYMYVPSEYRKDFIKTFDSEAIKSPTFVQVKKLVSNQSDADLLEMINKVTEQDKQNIKQEIPFAFTKDHTAERTSNSIENRKNSEHAPVYSPQQSDNSNFAFKLAKNIQLNYKNKLFNSKSDYKSILTYGNTNDFQKGKKGYQMKVSHLNAPIKNKNIIDLNDTVLAINNNIIKAITQTRKNETINKIQTTIKPTFRKKMNITDNEKHSAFNGVTATPTTVLLLNSTTGNKSTESLSPYHNFTFNNRYKTIKDKILEFQLKTTSYLNNETTSTFQTKVSSFHGENVYDVNKKYVSFSLPFFNYKTPSIENKTVLYLSNGTVRVVHDEVVPMYNDSIQFGSHSNLPFSSNTGHAISENLTLFDNTFFNLSIESVPLLNIPYSLFSEDIFAAYNETMVLFRHVNGTLLVSDKKSNILHVIDLVLRNKTGNVSDESIFPFMYNNFTILFSNEASSFHKNNISLNSNKNSFMAKNNMSLNSNKDNFVAKNNSLPLENILVLNSNTRIVAYKIIVLNNGKTDAEFRKSISYSNRNLSSQANITGTYGHKTKPFISNTTENNSESSTSNNTFNHKTMSFCNDTTEAGYKSSPSSYAVRSFNHKTKPYASTATEIGIKTTFSPSNIISNFVHKTESFTNKTTNVGTKIISSFSNSANTVFHKTKPLINKTTKVGFKRKSTTSNISNIIDHKAKSSSSKTTNVDTILTSSNKRVTNVTFLNALYSTIESEFEAITRNYPVTATMYANETSLKFRKSVGYFKRLLDRVFGIK